MCVVALLIGVGVACAVKEWLRQQSARTAAP
jgi:hypothetical protein